ncbi:hypothetical protein [Geobacter sp.]|uniref:hypothetical protein n=1 Tax=Geobacter sp. TaxID=46610 RepID=UPI001AD4FDB0|nr:hypothetical protein [Geobacter sp.]CAG0977820.1 hypothetical protein ANRL4_01680 [Anaerolineae bacterium]
MKISRGFRIIGVAAALAAAVPAAGQVLTDLDGLDAREVVSDQELDSIRGGIDMGNGFLLLFSVDQLVRVNGVLQYTTTQPVLSPTGQTVSPASLQRFMDLYGSGAGTSQPGSPSNALTQPLIQNSLDNQPIEVITTINAAALNLSRIRSMNISPMVTGQLIRSLR